jgi:uncharacterized protein with GYD domain
MPTYVSLVSLADKAMSGIKTLYGREQATRERMAEAGIRVKSSYLVMGEYDEVIVWDAPNAEVGAAWLLEVGAGGLRRTVTLRAFDAEELRRILEKAP